VLYEGNDQVIQQVNNIKYAVNIEFPDDFLIYTAVIIADVSHESEMKVFL
jgi:hypothetical protein